MPRIISLGFALFICTILLVGCASRPHLRATRADETTPKFIQLEREQSISTFHFPRGLYSLDLEDGAGSYYRAPRGIITHSFAGFAPYDGGLFVPKNVGSKVRGYVIWAGGRTKIGDLSRADYHFRD